MWEALAVTPNGTRIVIGREFTQGAAEGIARLWREKQPLKRLTYTVEFNPCAAPYDRLYGIRKARLKEAA